MDNPGMVFIGLVSLCFVTIIILSAAGCFIIDKTWDWWNR